MAKLNDFYYQLDGEKRWYSWREVCEYRREYGSTKIISKRRNDMCMGELVDMEEKTRVVYSEITKQYSDVMISSETLTTVTLRFHRAQFPSETYDLIFDKRTGDPLNKKFVGKIYLGDVDIPMPVLRIFHVDKNGKELK
jgi:hypothetical protein